MRATADKLRILFVHDRFGAFGGAESNILTTAIALREHGSIPAILHGAPTGRSEETWTNTFPCRFSFAESDSGEAVSAAMTSFQPDVIYVHNLADLDAIVALLASGVSSVRMVHDHDLYCMRSYKYNYVSRQICDRALSPYCVVPCGAVIKRGREGDFPIKWVSYFDKVRELELNRRFDRVLVASHFMKAELLRNRFSEEKIEIHPPVPQWNGATLQSNFSDRNLIVYSGQITRGKGVDVLLQSLAQVNAPFECLIFGDGNYRGHSEKLCRVLGLSNRVHFKGYVPPEEISRHYRECSVAVVSSVWPEPFGAAGLEGMCYGIPVVAFDAGGIKEWLTDGINGFLVPWMNHILYAKRVEQLLVNKTLAREMGERGRQTVAECFSFSKYIDGLENLFTRLSARCGQMAYT